MSFKINAIVAIAALTVLFPSFTSAQVAVRGKKIYTMAGATIEDGTVVIEKGKITAIGRAGQIAVPEGFRTLQAEIVTPGLVDAHTTVGFSGILNSPHDQDQLERSSPIQPELRAIDAFNIQDDLVEWVRGFGVTTIHAGHAPGELISGQTLIAKTTGRTAADAVMNEARAVAVTIAQSAQKTGGKSPGTRGKTIAMLRSELIKAREFRDKQTRAAAGAGAAGGGEKPEKPDAPGRDLRMEALWALADPADNDDGRRNQRNRPQHSPPNP